MAAPAVAVLSGYPAQRQPRIPGKKNQKLSKVHRDKVSSSQFRFESSDRILAIAKSSSPAKMVVRTPTPSRLRPSVLTHGEWHNLGSCKEYHSPIRPSINLRPHSSKVATTKPKAGFTHRKSTTVTAITGQQEGRVATIRSNATSRTPA